MPESDQERLRRWRLVLGGGEADGTEQALDAPSQALDDSLSALYDADRAGGLGDSKPSVARWLGDIRRFFPTEAVQVMQKDALERLELTRMLLEPELLEAVEPDVELVATLLSLRSAMPARTRDSARKVVSRVVEQLERRLTRRTRSRLSGSLDRAARTRRPRPADIDWHRTILKNLGTWQPELGTLIPEVLVGHPRRRSAMGDVFLLIDQSGSMAASLVYAGVLGAALAGVAALRTRLAVFDTEVADLSEHLHDPVELLFAAQLGGGTDIGRALAWVRGRIERPSRSLVVLVTDLFDGGDESRTVEHVAQILRSGARVITLLALSDRGAPAHNHRLAARLAALDVPCFACTPELFPELMAAAIEGRDLSLWAAREGIVLARGEET
ncbi:MAG: VWA domain-containing protein [Alphaproteobacteria bacterium]|nr:VWA domain-containing protein [Alphaproteobacteria bacterium]MCB9797508.1 VWA domain-containing protein [Alphaproteobacteria bacterium]